YAIAAATADVRRITFVYCWRVASGLGFRGRAASTHAIAAKTSRSPRSCSVPDCDRGILTLVRDFVDCAQFEFEASIGANADRWRRTRRGCSRLRDFEFATDR